MRDERPPRLRLIRVFLSTLAGFMAGLMGWMIVMVLARVSSVPAQGVSVPLAWQAIAFLGPAIVTGSWLFMMMGKPRSPAK
jgi:hypothetical protein